MALPRHNTIEEDRSHFASERQQMLLAQGNFKLGLLSSGVTAISYLESMYQILLAGPYQQEHEEDAKKYRADIEQFRIDLITEIDKRKDEQPLDVVRSKTYQALLVRYNELVDRMYKIKSIVGMS